jgi:hypothetical protein
MCIAEDSSFPFPRADCIRQGSSTRIVNGQVVVSRNIIQKLFHMIYIFFRAIYYFFKTLVVPLSTLEPQRKGGGTISSSCTCTCAYGVRTPQHAISAAHLRRAHMRTRLCDFIPASHERRTWLAGACLHAPSSSPLSHLYAHTLLPSFAAIFPWPPLLQAPLLGIFSLPLSVSTPPPTR